MSHPDQELLVGFALGEEDDADLTAHVEGCEACQRTVGRTSDLLGAVRRLDGGPLVLEQPPAHVWAAVREAVDPVPVRSLPDAAPTTRRTSRRWQPFAAAAAGLLAGVAATIGVVVALDDSPTPAAPPAMTRTSVLAGGPVTPIAPATTSGEAEVLEQSGTRRLHVELADLPTQADSYVQAWLFDPRTNEMVAIGVMDAADESFAIPASIDLGVYSSLDLSLEALDGNPAHGATSLAQAALEPS